jgi:hypothetical protein
LLTKLPDAELRADSQGKAWPAMLVKRVLERV